MRRPPRSRARRGGPERAPCRPIDSGDTGAAVVEFVVVAVAVLVPLAYVVLAVLRVESAAYAVTQAAREAGRAFVAADTVGAARQRAAAAVRLALADQGVAGGAESLTVRCVGGPCLAPGSAVEVRVAVRVALPLVPALDGGRLSVPVDATHLAPVDEYRSEP